MPRSLVSGLGSSPRMRGAHRQPWQGCDRPGIIPADAGSTRKSRIIPLCRQDHPRGCGKHGALRTILCAVVGSSPRMRGAQRPEQRDKHNQRIIPADAGSTIRVNIYLRPWMDHPRGCGEHETAWLGFVDHLGSSPRMRGAHDFLSPDGEFLRIIPADAGSTGGRGCSGGLSRDHPRGCGEHFGPTALPVGQGGSSPRMRGAPGQAGRERVCLGIIPADAGSTTCTRTTANRTKDHPRGCGEHD